ncbi:DUF4019 domain-containing protein [Paraburkholderia sp. UYCP14C]|uniref:DUF4019 domain-containing protein n=1 Tax=Paraburkholderia sp. UYCP14C TaxID=2511130 RepID=UPI00101FCFA6|nr:DUF4019 domain-containing protein [Paraburkholderia sp. UYCP14C]RZF30208.1 DUF4019 domain-containing protein [Paraburkholderia sp. UYCP14C]
MKHITSILKLAAICVLGTSCTIAAAAQGTSADELLTDADRVFQQFDSNHYAEAWRDAAPFVKAKIPQAQFVSTTREAREALGAVTRRGWSSITRIQYIGFPGIPDGLYANVDFTSTLASGRTVFELLSFQLDADGQWHLTGYIPRQPQGATAVNGAKP